MACIQKWSLWASFRNGDRDFCHELFYTEYMPRIDSALTVPYSIKALFAIISVPNYFCKSNNPRHHRTQYRPYNVYRVPNLP